jgi:hypothetical protein
VDPLVSALEGGTKMVISGSDIQPIYTKDLFINNNQDLSQDVDIRFELDTSRLIAQVKLRENCGGLQVYDKDFALVPIVLERGCNTDKTIFWLRANNLATGVNKFTLAYNIFAPDIPSNYTGLTNQLISDSRLSLRVSSAQMLETVSSQDGLDTIRNFANPDIKITGKATLKKNPANQLTGLNFSGNASYLDSKLENKDFSEMTVVSLWSKGTSVSSANMWSMTDGCYYTCSDGYKYNTRLSSNGVKISLQEKINRKNSTVGSSNEKLNSSEFLLTQFQNQDQYLLYTNNSIEKPLTATTKVATNSSNNLRIGANNPNLYLHEFLVFDKPLTTFETQQIRNYLAQTYDLQNIFSFPQVSIEEDEEVSSLISINSQKQWAQYISDTQIQFFTPNFGFNDYTSVDLGIYNYDLFDGEAFFKVTNLFAYSKTANNLQSSDFDPTLISDVACKYELKNLSCDIKTLAKVDQIGFVQVVQNGTISSSCQIELGQGQRNCEIPNLDLADNSLINLIVGEETIYKGIQIARTNPNPTPQDQSISTEETQSTSQQSLESSEPSASSSSQESSINISQSSQTESQSSLVSSGSPDPTQAPEVITQDPLAAVDTQQNVISSIKCNSDNIPLNSNFGCSISFEASETAQPFKLYYFIDDVLASETEFAPSPEAREFIWDGLDISNVQASKISFNTLNDEKTATSLKINVTPTSLIGINEPLFAFAEKPDITILPNTPAILSNDDSWRVGTIVSLGVAMIAIISAIGYYTLRTTAKKYTFDYTPPSPLYPSSKPNIYNTYNTPADQPKKNPFHK